MPHASTPSSVSQLPKHLVSGAVEECCGSVVVSDEPKVVPFSWLRAAIDRLPFRFRSLAEDAGMAQKYAGERCSH